MKNLQYYRDRKKELKLTNDDISEKSGIPKRTVEDFFRGATPNPRIDTVQAIEHALGLDDDAQSPTVNIPEKYSEVFVALNEGDKDLTQDDVDDIIRFIEFRKSTKKK